MSGEPTGIEGGPSVEEKKAFDMSKINRPEIKMTTPVADEKQQQKEKQEQKKKQEQEKRQEATKQQIEKYLPEKMVEYRNLLKELDKNWKREEETFKRNMDRIIQNGLIKKDSDKVFNFVLESRKGLDEILQSMQDITRKIKYMNTRVDITF